MALLCLECFQVYKNSYGLNNSLDYLACPKMECEGEVVEIDELMLPIIITFNAKGYYTKYCCSGHLFSMCSPYVFFDDIFGDCECSREEFISIFKELPKPWFIDINKKDENNEKRVIRCAVPDFDSVVEHQKFINDVNLDLLKFAQSLPNLFK